MGSELRLYDVTVGKHKTRMRLDDADAEARGDSAVLVTEPPAPPVARPAAADPAVGKARPVTANKMRGTSEPSAHDETGS